MASKRPRIMVTEAEYQAIVEVWAEWEAGHENDEGQDAEHFRKVCQCLERFNYRWAQAAARRTDNCPMQYSNPPYGTLGA